MTTTTSPSLPTTARRPWTGPAATVWSLLAAAAGAWWLTVPDTYPDHFDGPVEDGSLLTLLEPSVVSALVLVLGVGGALASTVAGTRRSWLIPFGIGYAVVFGAMATDLSLLVSMGYSTAILGPPLLFGYLVLASFRRPALRWVVAGVIAAAAAGASASGATLSSFADFADALGEGLARSGIGMLVNVAAFVGGVLWLLVALHAAGFRRASRTTGPSFVVPNRDWGWWVTVAAALCPLPYALMRMTWLTPWPTIIDADTLNAQPSMRIFGLSLGFAAIGGAILTLGLLMRWGSIYPRWIPVVGGRSVSPVWPTAFAVVVGVAVTVAGRSMLQMALAGEEFAKTGAETFLILPLPVWGPLLVAAAIAYYRRRTLV